MGPRYDIKPKSIKFAPNEPKGLSTHPSILLLNMKLNTLRILIVSSLTLLPIAATNIHAAKGEKTFGVKTGYVSRNKSALAGITFQCGISDHFRLAPSAECIFRHDDRDALQIDLDAHFPFSFTGERAALYPIAGINYSSWNRHSTEIDDDQESKDVSTRSGYLGLNAGCGFEFKASSTLKLSLEARYSLVKSNSSVQISVGIGYMF